MKIKNLEIGCGWGFGPDVAINVYHDGLLVPVDLTADEADLVARALMLAAAEARRLDKLCEEHDGFVGAFERDTDG